MTEPMATMAELELRAEVRELRAALERETKRADELGRRLISKTMALQEAEDSVDRLQSSKAALQAEIKGLYSAGPTLSEWAELTQARSKAEAEVRELRAEIASLQELAYFGEHHFPDLTYKARNEELRAALERARALLRDWRNADFDNTQLGAVMCDELAAALAEAGRP